ncbi:conserved hypothetical protein [Leishmania major strain Friedlin]|uniref:Uncharacterized protein n=1 Tax=Leishmania major TaxID=5664 RepID=Q4QD08_LEIMA|nr:conserved hypothetical protein [Leishmania major strain Friedlin]CAG9573107.1 hypothetical_protein_-_conserved [Leishmania major strain Friedlin]CAJ03633.1 conserved hypothetical protein [Leishmania major strain Friedlin]|eukprot:XP_001682790.1 conserved hypothetical protein [Leishmania major strain Friedlin]
MTRCPIFQPACTSCLQPFFLPALVARGTFACGQGQAPHGARGGQSDASLRMSAVIPRTAWPQSELRQCRRVRHPWDGQCASLTRTNLTRSSHCPAGGGGGGGGVLEPPRWLHCVATREAGMVGGV